eukprot:2930675-Prymnesium_polylepis.1
MACGSGSGAAGAQLGNFLELADDHSLVEEHMVRWVADEFDPVLEFAGALVLGRSAGFDLRRAQDSTSEERTRTASTPGARRPKRLERKAFFTVNTSVPSHEIKQHASSSRLHPVFARSGSC